MSALGYVSSSRTGSGSDVVIKLPIFFKDDDLVLTKGTIRCYQYELTSSQGAVLVTVHANLSVSPSIQVFEQENNTGVYSEVQVLSTFVEILVYILQVQFEAGDQVMIRQYFLNSITDNTFNKTASPPLLLTNSAKIFPISVSVFDVFPEGTRYYMSASIQDLDFVESGPGQGSIINTKKTVTTSCTKGRIFDPEDYSFSPSSPSPASPSSSLVVDNGSVLGWPGILGIVLGSVVVLILIIIGGVYFFKSKSSTTPYSRDAALL